MRGTLAGTIPVDAVHGIIPAYAGNTFSATPTPTSTGDHPRVCGEHDCGAGIQSTAKGSSPRMRGTRYRLERGWIIVGIIPAYAGNTIQNRPFAATVGDHPRVCGEHTRTGCSGRTVLGSSPRMRGTRIHANVAGRTVGIIPAYAGNTRSTTNTLDCTEDHPRVCGEHDSWGWNVVITLGSSPRMRGTPGGR